MDNASTRAQLLEHFLSFFMPEGILDFFEPVWMETQSLDSRESKKDILYTGTLHMYLDERDNRAIDNCVTRKTILSSNINLSIFFVSFRV